MEGILKKEVFCSPYLLKIAILLYDNAGYRSIPNVAAATLTNLPGFSLGVFNVRNLAHRSAAASRRAFAGAALPAGAQADDGNACEKKCFFHASVVEFGQN
jgi:hypothetical protein